MVDLSDITLRHAPNYAPKRLYYGTALGTSLMGQANFEGNRGKNLGEQVKKAVTIPLILAAVLLSRPGLAATVTSTADNGPGSLRQAIANAAAGETIDFAVSGTITLTSGELLITKNLISSGPVASNLVVQ